MPKITAKTLGGYFCVSFFPNGINMAYCISSQYPADHSGGAVHRLPLHLLDGVRHGGFIALTGPDRAFGGASAPESQRQAAFGHETVKCFVA